MLIRKSDVKAPSLPEEVVSVPELGGDVLVRGLDLGERMNLAHQLTDKSRPSSKDFGHLAPLLELSVLDADGEQLFTAAEWAAWGAKNLAAAVSLWDTAWRLSDIDGKQAEKNATAPTSD
jgi:hypothetical protein